MATQSPLNMTILALRLHVSFVPTTNTSSTGGLSSLEEAVALQALLESVFTSIEEFFKKTGATLVLSHGEISPMTIFELMDLSNSGNVTPFKS